jgi:heptosyltransferase-2
MNSPGQRISSPLPARLLIDLPNWLGDQVMALPAVHRMVTANAGAETTLHARPRMVRFVKAVFPTTCVVASPPKAFPLNSAMRLCRQGGRFRVGVTLRHAYRAKIVLGLAARRSYGSAGSGAWPLLSQRFPVDRSAHQVRDADPILAALGLEPAASRWRPALPSELLDEGARELRRAGVDGRPLVGLAPATARGPARRWPAARFAELAHRLRAAGVTPVVIAGPGEEGLAAEVAGDAIAVAGPTVDVAGLAGVLAGLGLLVTNDSGPMHLAAAVGTRVVALIGPTDPVRTAPLGEGHALLSLDLDCAPCLKSDCPLGHTACMNELSVDRVFDAVIDVVQATR